MAVLQWRLSFLNASCSVFVLWCCEHVRSVTVSVVRATSFNSIATATNTNQNNGTELHQTHGHGRYLRSKRTNVLDHWDGLRKEFGLNCFISVWLGGSVK